MLAIGCDQGGYDLKISVLKYLEEKGIPYHDFGSYSQESTDYPIYAKLVANAILENECEMGILICGTGIGISIVANRHQNIRCALCHDVFSAKASRSHNNANILAMGGRVIGVGLALEVLDAFLTTPFPGESRHKRRITMMDE